jgi:hypothetical protein
MTVEEAGRFLDFGRAKSYQEANRYLRAREQGLPEQGLPCVRFGRTIRVPVAELRRMLRLD